MKSFTFITILYLAAIAKVSTTPHTYQSRNNFRQPNHYNKGRYDQNNNDKYNQNKNGYGQNSNDRYGQNDNNGYDQNEKKYGQDNDNTYDQNENKYGQDNDNTYDQNSGGNYGQNNDAHDQSNNNYDDKIPLIEDPLPDRDYRGWSTMSNNNWLPENFSTGSYENCDPLKREIDIFYSAMIIANDEVKAVAAKADLKKLSASKRRGSFTYRELLHALWRIHEEFAIWTRSIVSRSFADKGNDLMNAITVVLKLLGATETDMKNCATDKLFTSAGYYIDNFEHKIQDLVFKLIDARKNQKEVYCGNGYAK